MKRNARIWTAVIVLVPFASTWADEMGSGRTGNDIPDAQPPADPAPSETSETLLQQLLEAFDVVMGGAEN